MLYSIEPREKKYVKGYGFLSFARNIGTHAAKATGDLVGNKSADKITAKPSKKSHNEEMQSNEVKNGIPKERYIYPKERQKIIDELKLI